MTYREHFDWLWENVRNLLRKCSVEDVKSKTPLYLEFKLAQAKFNAFPLYIVRQRARLDELFVETDAG